MMMNSLTGLITLLLILLFASPGAKGLEGGKSFAACQRALLAGKVANGEFTEETLEKALSLPAENISSEDEVEIRKLFARLGAARHADREAATKELINKYKAPGTVSALLKEEDDPEIIERAGEVLASWRVADPDHEFLARFKMWMNCPPCMAKLKFCREMYDKARQTQKHQICFDHIKGLNLDDFPAGQRIRAVTAWMDLCVDKWGIATFSFFDQLKKEEWHDKELLESIRKALGKEDSSFCSTDLENLLWNIPEDVDLKGWLPMLNSAVARKGAIAAVLVKTGHREAIPAFIDLLNTEWTSCSQDKGRINGGGHSMFFSPFYRFEILNIQEYRKYASDIMKGLEHKFSDDRTAFHNAYLNAVKPFADTDAGKDLLVRLSTNKNSQTVITACLMLYNQTGKQETLDYLAGALEKTSPQDVANNSSELIDLFRMIRGRIYLEPDKADYYRKYIRTSAECFLRNIIDSAPDYSDQSVFDFFFDELGSFDLVSPDRTRLIEMMATRTRLGTWEYPESAVSFLVKEARKKGDLGEMLDKLGVMAGRKEAGTGDVVLFVMAVMIAGEPGRLDAIKDKFSKLYAAAGDNKVSELLDAAAWVRFPQIIMDSPSQIPVNSLIINSGKADLGLIARKLSAKGEKRFMSQLFRISHGLEGAAIGDFTELKDYEALNVFGEMAWKNPPPAADLKNKISDLCLQLKEGWLRREMVESVPEMVRRFGISFGEVGKGNPVLLQLVSEIAFRNGDRAAFDKAVASLVKDPDSLITGYVSESITMRKIIMELSEGRICEELRGIAGARKKLDSSRELYRLANILYERGFAEKARELRALAPEPDAFRKWDYSECCLPWAWNEAFAGNIEEAIKLSEAAVMSANFAVINDYSLMLRRLLRENTGEFQEFLKILAMQKDFSKRAEYADSLVKFAEKAADKDMKALAAFLAGRLALALDRSDIEVNRIWKLGADCGGFHSGYCKDAVSSVPEGKKEFFVSSSWYSRDIMPKELTPFTRSVGICFKAEKPLLAVDSSEWIGPYGVPVSREVMQYFCDGSGYWNYIRDQARAWVPGEWSIIVKYKDGVEYHQRTLLPYGTRKY